MGINYGTLWKLGKSGFQSNEYTQNRMSELQGKGYTAETAQNMIYFELGLKTSVDYFGSAHIARKTSMQGLLWGAEIGSTLGPQGAIIGGAIGFFGLPAGASKLLDYAVPKNSNKLLNGYFETLLCLN